MNVFVFSDDFSGFRSLFCEATDVTARDGEKFVRLSDVNADLIQSIKSCRESLIHANTRQSAVDWMVEADRLLAKCLKELNQ